MFFLIVPQAKLSKRFKVEGIPTFVIVDTATGEAVTRKARENVMQDPQGKNFPWKPKPLEQLLSGSALRGKDTVSLDQSTKGKFVGLYFSAHWVRLLCMLLCSNLL